MFEKRPPGCLYGRIIKSLEVSSFILTETAHKAMSRLPSHAHENSYFCFVLQGVYTERHGNRELACEPSTLTFRHSGEAHEDRFHDLDGRVFVLEIPSQWIERLRENSLTLKSTIEFRGGPLPQLTARLNHEFHKTDSAAGLAIEGLALEMMAEAARQSSNTFERATPRWLKRAREMLIEHFSEKLTLTQVAAQVGVHPVHLASVFRQQYGCTVGEFVRQLRIEHACREIVKGELALATIALEAGFADQSHFSKAFRFYIGMTPTEYQRSARIS